jgi:chromosome segregation ATPase
MKKLLFFASLLLILSLLALSQNEQGTSTNELAQQRRDAYQQYRNARDSVDANLITLLQFAQKTDALIQTDDILLDQMNQPDTVIAGLQARLAEAEKESKDEEATQKLAELGHWIATIAGGAMLVLLLLFFILFLVKNSKVKYLKKLYTGKDALIAEKETMLAQKESLHAEKDEKIAGLEKNLNEQNARFQKDAETLKFSVEQEKKNYRLKEEELNRKVTEIEEKIKQTSTKESDLNYQIFQLELRLKNELESILREKCELENKVIDLERELSEAKLALNEEMNRPRMNDNERSEMLGKISWLENEAPYLRQCIDNERIAKENAESALRDKQNELDNLYRERDGLRGRIYELEGQLNEQSNLVNDLQWLQNEKNQLLEQLQQPEYNEEAVNHLKNRIADLESQLNDWRLRAEEATHLKEQLDELLKFVDRLRG